eukprot:COSAG01_NODE_1071_length_11863_cov_36.887623_11_plen_418_part_00
MHAVASIAALLPARKGSWPGESQCSCELVIVETHTPEPCTTRPADAPPWGPVHAVTKGNPFDLANQHMTPPLKLSVPDTADPDRPQIRVFDNKFPVLAKSRPSTDDGSSLCLVQGLFPELRAAGEHEVIVQHHRYNMCEALMSDEEVLVLWRTLQLRFSAVASGAVRYVQLLENHGRRSGGSLPHPHSQLLGLPFVPGPQMARLRIAHEFWQRNDHRCIFDEIVRKTEEDKERVLVAGRHVLAFVPNAVEKRNEVWIVPRKYNGGSGASFGTASSEVVAEVATTCRQCLAMLYRAENDPDYNLVLRNAPVRPGVDIPDMTPEKVDEWYRWHLVIIPHCGDSIFAGVKAYGGFSALSGMPEDHAAALRVHASTAEELRLVSTPTAKLATFPTAYGLVAAGLTMVIAMGLLRSRRASFW